MVGPRAAISGGMGPLVCSTACLMMTACTGITRAMKVTEIKSAGLAGKGKAVLIENRSENAVRRRRFDTIMAMTSSM